MLPLGNPMFWPATFPSSGKINQISFKLSFRPTPILGFQKQHLIFSMSSLPFSPIHPSIKPQFLPSNQTPFQLFDQDPSMKPVPRDHEVPVPIQGPRLICAESCLPRPAGHLSLARDFPSPGPDRTGRERARQAGGAAAEAEPTAAQQGAEREPRERRGGAGGGVVGSGGGGTGFLLLKKAGRALFGCPGWGWSFLARKQSLVFGVAS